MTTQLDEFTQRAARFKGLAARLTEKDPVKARHYRKLMKRAQRRSVPLKKALAPKAEAKPADAAPPAEAKS